MLGIPSGEEKDLPESKLTRGPRTKIPVTEKHCFQDPACLQAGRAHRQFPPHPESGPLSLGKHIPSIQPIGLISLELPYCERKTPPHATTSLFPAKSEYSFCEMEGFLTANTLHLDETLWPFQM